MSFEKQFNSFYPTLKAIANRYARATDIPFAEYESALNEEFFLKYEQFDVSKNSSFSGYMRVRLTQRASRVAGRKERRYYDSVMFYEESDVNVQGDELEFELASEFNLEDSVIEREEKKTDADKLELINALTKDTDDTTRVIVQEFLRGEHAKPTAIGKALGIHHEVVKRKISRISRNFSESKYGKINAYLAV